MIEVKYGILNIYLPDDCDFVALSEKYPDVKAISIHKNYNNTESKQVSLRGVQNFKAVERISFYDENVKPTDLAFINYCENLEELSILAPIDFKEVENIYVPKMYLASGLCSVQITRTGFPREVDIFITAINDEITTDLSLKEIENIKNIAGLAISPKVKAKDFDALYEFKDLMYLMIPGQREVKQIDVSKFPKLYYLDLHGCGVEEVKGMNLKDPHKYSYYNFGNCSQLKEIEGIETFMHKMVDDQSITKRALVLDDVFYQKLMTKRVDGKIVNGELEQKLIHEQERKGGSSIGIVTEFCDNFHRTDSLTRGSPFQMKVQREYLDYVLKEECHIKETDSEWEKAKKAYDWVTENFKYANGMLNQEVDEIGCDESELDKRKKKFFGEKGYDHYYLAAPYFSLFARQDIALSEDGLIHYEGMNKYAVCEGIANVYVQMLEQMEIEAHFVLIAYINKENEQRLRDGHGFVAAKIDGEYRYFDPTWDLGKTEYSQFGLSFEQAKDKHFNFKFSKEKYDIKFANEEERFAGAKDIQSELEEKGLLERYKEENKNQAEESKKDEAPKMDAYAPEKEVTF